MSRTPCLLTAAARTRPEAPAAVSPEGTLTYRDYNESAQAVAKGLSEAGLMPGAVLGIAAPRSVEWLPLLMGCFRAGVAAFPVNTRLSPQAIQALLDGCDAQFTISQTPPQTCHPQTRLGVLKGNPSTSPPTPPQAGRMSFPPRLRGGRGGSFSHCPEAPPNKFGGVMSEGEVDPGAPAIILQTSGSTGKPKLAVLSYGNLRSNAEASNRNIPLAPGDVWLLTLPLYHVSGLGVLFRCLAAQATVAVPGEDDTLAESIELYRPTHVSLVTTQLHRMMQTPSGVRALKTLKAILLGGSAMPPQLIREALGLGLPIFTSYGLTETASQVATTTPSDRGEEALRRATPLYPDGVRISSEGEIEVSGPTLFLGYQEGGAIVRPATLDGWFPTGDLGQLDAQGRLTVVGRKDNLFISGGENIQPEEIERELCALAGVEAAVVVPVEDAEFGHRPVAFVKPDPDAESLREALRRRLPDYKIPVAFHPWPESLDTPGIKIQRHAFIAEAKRRM